MADTRETVLQTISAALREREGWEVMTGEDGDLFLVVGNTMIYRIQVDRQ